MEPEDQELQIVNRSREYYVSEKLMRSMVPYFENMISSCFWKSMENKVGFNFDEHAFNSIIDWVHSGSFVLQMDFVISLYEAADYLMINEPFLQSCSSYFHQNFSIEHLPVVLPQVSKVSRLVNSASIESFICRYFLMIANTDIFLDYPVELVEMIFKLDLMVYSEYQIFESIMKWVSKMVDSRKEFLPRLLNCVRWCFMDSDQISKIKDNELVKALVNFDSITTSNDDCVFNRSDQNIFVSIEARRDSPTLKIKIYDKELFCLAIGDFTRDNSMPLEFVHGEQTSDILFHFGRRGIRIDWVKKTFRWLNFDVAGKTYYSQVYALIYRFFQPQIISCHNCYLENEVTKLPDLISDPFEFSILESDGKYIVIGKTRDEKWFGLFPAHDESWFNKHKLNNCSFLATVLDNVVYILTKRLEFIQFNYETHSFLKSEPFKDENFRFVDLCLTSHRKGDDKVILVDTKSRKIYVFNIKQKKWAQKYQIMDVNVNVNVNSKNCLIRSTFFSAFLPMKVIKTLNKRKFSEL